MIIDARDLEDGSTLETDVCIDATGSSVFPTAGYANSTLTIIALAIRLADHLKARLRT